MAASIISRLCRFLLLLLALHLLPQTFGAQENDEQFLISAYVPDYRIAAVNLNASAPYLTDLILFSIQPHSRGFISGCCLEDSHYEKSRQAKEYKKQIKPGSIPLRLWVSVGGGGRSEALPVIAGDEKRRGRMLENLIKLCEKQDLVGVDFDLEGPRTMEDYQSWMRFLLLAASELHNVGLLISLTVHFGQKLPEQIRDAMDRIQVMAYDLPGAPYHADFNLVFRNVDGFLESGCPGSKLLLGLPAYARLEANPGQVRTFSELMDESNGRVVDTNVWNGYRFDSPREIRQKVARAKSIGLGGVFFWELGQDSQHDKLGPGGILLEAAALQVEAMGVAPMKEEL